MRQTLWDKLFRNHTKRLYEFFNQARDKEVTTMNIEKYTFVTTLGPDSKEVENVEIEFWLSYPDNGHVEEYMVSNFQFPTRNYSVKKYADRIKGILRRRGFEIGKVHNYLFQ